MWGRILVWSAVAPGTIWGLIRMTGWDTWYPMAQFISFTPYVAALALLPLLLTVLMRQWAATAVAGLVFVLLAAVVLPRWWPDSDADAGAQGPELRVMTANVLAGAADAGQLLDLVREHRVDVLLLQELTPDFVTEADVAGIAQLLPYRVVYPKPGVAGSGIFARHTLRDDGLRINPGGFSQARAELIQHRVLIESAHPMAPWGTPAMDFWRRSFPDQPRATVDGPLRILGGDFNATLDHSLLRDLIDSGYRDAAEVVGIGLTGTWGPYDGDKIPPVTLDRVLADRRIGILDVQVLNLRGSDHRPVVATLRLP